MCWIVLNFWQFWAVLPLAHIGRYMATDIPIKILIIQIIGYNIDKNNSHNINVCIIKSSFSILNTQNKCVTFWWDISI